MHSKTTQTNKDRKLDQVARLSKMEFEARASNNGKPDVLVLAAYQYAVAQYSAMRNS